jgi:hypothetical protein
MRNLFWGAFIIAVGVYMWAVWEYTKECKRKGGTVVQGVYGPVCVASVK